MLISIPQQAK